MASLGTCTFTNTAALAASTRPHPAAVQEVVARSIVSHNLAFQPKELEQLQPKLALQPPSLLVPAQQMSTLATPGLALLTHDCIGTAPSPAEPGLVTVLTTAAPAVGAHLHAEALLKATACSRIWLHNNNEPQLHLCSLPQPPLLMPARALSTSGLQHAIAVTQTEIVQSVVVWPNYATVIGMRECSRVWQQKQCQSSQLKLPYPAEEWKAQPKPALLGTVLQDALARSRHWLQHQQNDVTVMCNREQHASRVSAWCSESNVEPPTAMLLDSLACLMTTRRLLWHLGLAAPRQQAPSSKQAS